MTNGWISDLELAFCLHFSSLFLGIAILIALFGINLVLIIELVKLLSYLGSEFL